MGVNISNLKLLFIPPGTVFIGSKCSFCWIHVPPRAHLAELTLSLKTCWTVARIPHTYGFYISSNKCAHRVWPRFFPFAWKKKNPPVCWKRYGWELWITKSTHALACQQRRCSSVALKVRLYNLETAGQFYHNTYIQHTVLQKTYVTCKCLVHMLIYVFT